MILSTVALYTVFLLIVLVLVKPLGGYLARVFAGQKTWLDPALRTDSLLFASVIVGTALIVVALTYLPVVALGPIIEHLQL